MREWKWKWQRNRNKNRQKRIVGGLKNVKDVGKRKRWMNYGSIHPLETGKQNGQSQKMGWCWQFAFLTDGNNSTNCACQQIVYRKLSHSHTQLCNAYMYTFLRLKVVIRMLVINTHTQQQEIDRDSRIKLQWNEFLVIIYDCFPNWNNFRISDAKGLFSILKNFRNFQPDQRKFSW